MSGLISTIRTNSEHPDFQELVRALDKDLALRDGADHGFYAQFNKIDLIQHAIVAYAPAQKSSLPDTVEQERAILQKHAILQERAILQGHAVGCGAIKAFSNDAMHEAIEVKRMYVPPDQRGNGIASFVLSALEEWAKEMGYKRCVLETGKRQPEAIALYKKNGYTITPNYGQYIGIANSVCFEKVL